MAVAMKEWHVVVLKDGNKTLFDKIFFNVADAHAVQKEKREEYAEEIKEGTVRVVREYY